MNILFFAIIGLLIVGFVVAFLFVRRYYEKRIKREIWRAQKSEQLKKAFIENVSQTLRIPLKAISGYSNMLLEMPGEVIPAGQVKDVARNINVDSEDLLGFVGQLLEMSKFEGITPHFTFIEVNLTELMASYRREIMIIAKPEITVRVKTNLSPHCKATLDTNLMHQLMMHLLTNAAKHSIQSDILINYSYEHGGLNVSITYSGNGKAEMIGADLYSFLQKEDALKHINESSILGLSLCKAIVEMLGGEFYMETEDGRKTIASFWFPCEMRDRYKDI